MVKDVELQVLELTRQGLKVSDVAEKVGVSRSAVQRIRKKHNLSKPVTARATPLQEHNVITLTRQGGFRVKDIAEKVGVDERVVYRIRQRHKLSKPMPKPWTAEETIEAERLLDEGLSYNEIARTLGRSPEHIRKKFPNRGWTREQTTEFVSWSAKLKHARKRLELTKI